MQGSEPPGGERARNVAGIVGCILAAWLIAYFTWSSEPAAYDFIAFYAGARLVATGRGALVTDSDALVAMEHEMRPERTILFGYANPPALALLMAPLGALPLEVAYAIWSGLGAIALAGAALLLAPLAPPGARRRLFPFALLAPPSLIALAHGQTTPFVLLALAGALRAPPLASGALLGLVVFRPQLLPLFALIALTRRRRAVGMIATVAAVALLSLAAVGPEGIASYPSQLAISATELRPGELGLPPLARRVIGGGDIVVNVILAALAVVAGAVAVLSRSGGFGARFPDAAIWSILAAPHALLHDGVFAYPGVARSATSTRATAFWLGSGLVVSLVQVTGVPVAALWLIANWWWRRPRDAATRP